MAKPQIMPVIVAWAKILWRYEGLPDVLDGNLLGDINDIADLGIGPSKEPIQQVNKKMELLLAPAIKQFTTSEALCEHLRVCVLKGIIRDSAKGNTNATKAWTLANNNITAMTRMNTPVTMIIPVTMAIITNAITLA